MIDVPPIRVYKWENRYGYHKPITGNGERCLFPTSAEVTLNENEAHTMRMEHPIDEDGAWKTLIGHNLLYVPIMEHGVMKYQPLRIYKIQKKHGSNGSASIAVEARHVFYDWNNREINRDLITTDNRLSIEEAFNGATQRDDFNNRNYGDLHMEPSNVPSTHYITYKRRSFTNFIIGGNDSLVGIYGGAFKADGFTFSINMRRTGSLLNAFRFVYNSNISGITATYDYDKMYNALSAESNFGDRATRYLQQYLFPFHKCAYVTFNYNTEAEKNRNFENDVNAYWDEIQRLSASYQITPADLPQADEFKDIRRIGFFEVGDTGYIHDDELGIETNQKIISKTLDVLTQETKSLLLGSRVNSTTEVKQYNNVVSGG